MKETLRQISPVKLIAAAKLLKTIAHPARLEILEVLESEEPLDVSTICKRIEHPCEISMMSHHLSKLKDNGILHSEKQGKHIFYRLADRRMLSIFDCMDKCNII